MDTGPILSSKSININPSDTYKTIHDKLSNLTAEMLVKTQKSILMAKLYQLSKRKMVLNMLTKLSEMKLL